jgi:hypothetical protein
MTHFKRIKVFISYAHSDRQQAVALREYLPQQLFDVFFDRDRLFPGWTWEPGLLQTIRDADAFVLLVGAETLDREYVNKEVDTFLSSRESAATRGLIPVLIDGCETIPGKVAPYQALDLRGEDALSRARSIGQAVHGVFFLPATEQAHMERMSSREPEQGEGERLQRLWEAGEVGLSPQAASQLMNRGIVPSTVQCAHREMDVVTLQPKQCESVAAVLCVACTTGACEAAYHLYGRFCTLLPPGDLLGPGTKLFYWCGTCRGPVCVRCLEIQDDYPCAPDRVLSYRFHCPGCRSLIQVVPVLDVDMEGVARECLKWAQAGGPPVIADE